MLVLTRKNRERILIGENIWVEVVNIRGDRVQLAIDAPKSVSIKREELLGDNPHKRTPPPVEELPDE